MGEVEADVIALWLVKTEVVDDEHHIIYEHTEQLHRVIVDDEPDMVTIDEHITLHPDYDDDEVDERELYDETKQEVMCDELDEQVEIIQQHLVLEYELVDGSLDDDEGHLQVQQDELVDNDDEVIELIIMLHLEYPEQLILDEVEVEYLM